MWIGICTVLAKLIFWWVCFLTVVNTFRCEIIWILFEKFCLIYACVIRTFFHQCTKTALPFLTIVGKGKGRLSCRIQVVHSKRSNSKKNSLRYPCLLIYQGNKNILIFFFTFSTFFFFLTLHSQHFLHEINGFKEHALNTSLCFVHNFLYVLCMYND